MWKLEKLFDNFRLVNSLYSYSQWEVSVSNLDNHLYRSYSTNFKVHLEKFSTSRGPVEFLICNDKNETIITSKYRKILGFSYSLY